MVDTKAIQAANRNSLGLQSLPELLTMYIYDITATAEKKARARKTPFSNFLIIETEHDRETMETVNRRVP